MRLCAIRCRCIEASVILITSIRRVKTIRNKVAIFSVKQCGILVPAEVSRNRDSMMRETVIVFLSNTS